MITNQVSELLARRALLVLLDRACGEITMSTEDFDTVEGFGVTVKAFIDPPRFILTLISTERIAELVAQGVPSV